MVELLVQSQGSAVRITPNQRRCHGILWCAKLSYLTCWCKKQLHQQIAWVTNTLVMSQMCGCEIGINYQDKPGICEERAKHTILYKTRNKLFAGTLPANNSLLAGTLLANEYFFVGTKCLRVHLSTTLKVKWFCPIVCQVQSYGLHNTLTVL